MGTLFAYIDPFTGSLVIQLLVMAFVSMMVFFKKVKTVILGTFGIGIAVNTEDAQTIKLEENKDDEQKKAA